MLRRRRGDVGTWVRGPTIPQPHVPTQSRFSSPGQARPGIEVTNALQDDPAPGDATNGGPVGVELPLLQPQHAVARHSRRRGPPRPQPPAPAAPPRRGPPRPPGPP